MVPAMADAPQRPLAVGVDVGSTTVKVVAFDPEREEVRWRDYRRHETRQAACTLAALEALFEHVGQARVQRLFMTGSGAGPIAEALGARFVQEVNAVTLAAQSLHPDAGSVIELGGQDAKIIVFRVDPVTGARTATTSMNDKCASGTGATLDKCSLKVGMAPEALARLRFDPARLHPVAAKCGVFAETDIVNLLKAGVPAPEIMCSLADAIVSQNLSVLARGNTLAPKVLLLGGPNTFLPFLVACWRLRIPESWAQRGLVPEPGLDPACAIVVPEHAQFFAAIGAVQYGLQIESEPFGGLEPLRRFVAQGRAAALAARAGPPLVRSPEELEAFRARYPRPAFAPPALPAGTEVRAVIGLDGGSTSSKCVLVDEQGRILNKAYVLSEGNPIADAKAMLRSLRDHAAAQGARLQIVGLGVTGYAAEVLERVLHADVAVVETIAHMMSARHYFGDVDVICDIGGQDIKVLFMEHGAVKGFRLSNQCSAGNGMLLQAMADQFGVRMQDYAEHAFAARMTPRFGYGCAVFLDTDRVDFQKQGFDRDELLAGLAMVLPKNVWQYVVQAPRLADFGTKFVLQGGTQRNLAAVKAQVDYIHERVPGAEVHVHPHAAEAGAIGAAMQALEVVRAEGATRFVGLEAAIALEYETKNDEETRCGFCSNQCSRTFVDARTPDGATSRFISGFACDNGSVQSSGELRALARARRATKRSSPNLVHEEARLLFRRVYTPAQVTSGAARAWRSELRIGIPRVLGQWTVAPFFRAYFEALGVRSENVVFSPETSEALYAAGARYGAVDPCFPAKVAQAHLHSLLFEAHEREALDYVFFPCITHNPPVLRGVMDTAACPVVAGTPKVLRAAFTKQVDFFAERGLRYLDPALSFAEPELLKRALFEALGPALQITAAQSDLAAQEGWAAMRAVDQRLEARGREVLDMCAKQGRRAVLMVGRPYHGDPGLHHGAVDELVSRGYPVISVRSLPKDRNFLDPLFAEDLAAGRIEHPLEIDDVWPENYSSNSALRVWAAKVAARHPNLAVLDLSSFKCGHDAPTYGILDRIFGAARTPHAALHDIDANWPAGSMRLRLSTFTHTLERRPPGRAPLRILSDAPPPPPREHAQWVDPPGAPFLTEQRAHTTILCGGLTVAHDVLMASALQGLGYRMQVLETPDQAALRVGQEYGNRGQCNPTYFMVGNLVKFLLHLRDERGLSVEQIKRRYIYLTAGACGPCRFGAYVTEYRKALRDAGFEGFRIFIFQQKGGLRQAGGDSGIDTGPAFFWALAKAFTAGDALNALAYRIRPYEVQVGATDRAVAEGREILSAALRQRRPLLPALLRVRRGFARVAVDRLQAKPKVGIIGEFWAMTTEGDGNYRLQRFLEAEGAEVDSQLLTSWLLYNLWQVRYDADRREGLPGRERAPLKRKVTVRAAELALRATFQAVANSMGLHGYPLPDMDEIAALAHEHYDNQLRGGEGHMEVGKLIQNVLHQKVNMTVSVKPFGCMPSSAVSDGVQAKITQLHPQAAFCAVETSGDGAVNVHSRVQMTLFEARRRADEEHQRALAAAGLTAARAKAILGRTPGLRSPLFPLPSRHASSAANAARLAGLLRRALRRR